MEKHILYDSVYVDCPEKTNLSSCPELKIGIGKPCTFYFLSDTNILKLDFDDACITQQVMLCYRNHSLLKS